VLIAVIHLIVVGHVFTFGFLVDPFMKTFTIVNGTTIVNSTELSLTYVSSIGTIQIGLFTGLQFLTALAFTYRTEVQFSKWPESFVIFGIVCWFSGTFASTYTTSGPELFGVYATLTGVGSALIYWTTLAMITDIDAGDKTLTFVLTFGGLGQLLFSILVAPYYTLEYVDGFGATEQSWKITLRAVAILGFCLMTICIGIIAALRLNICCVTERRQVEYTPVSIQQSLSQSNVVKLNRIFLFGSPNVYAMTAYWLLVKTTLMSGFAMYAPYVQLVEFMLNLSPPLTTFETTLVLMLVAITSIIGRGVLIFVPFCFGRRVSREYMLWPYILLIVQIYNVVVIGCWQVIYSYAGAMIFAAFFGLGFGILFGTTLLLTKDFSRQVYCKNGELNLRQNTFALHLIPISLAMAISAVGAGTVFGAIFDACNADGTGYLCAINSAMGFQLAAVLTSAFFVHFTWKAKNFKSRI